MNSVQIKANVDVTRTLEYIEVTRTLAAFRISYDVLWVNGEKEKNRQPPSNLCALLKASAQQGLALKEDIEKFANDKNERLKESNFKVVSPAFLRDAQARGFSRAVDLHYPDIEAKTQSAFDLASQGGLTSESIVDLDHAGHMLFDTEGAPLPTAVLFDYIKGRVNNENYCLGEVLPVLKANPHVVPFDVGSHRPTSKKPELHIMNIPYYNATEECSAAIEFLYCPDKETMAAIWGKMKELNSKYPTTMGCEAVTELDLLGIKKFRNKTC